MVSFADTDLNLLDGFSNKGEINIQSGVGNQDVELVVPNSVALQAAEFQSLYITAGAPTARPQLDLTIFKNTPLSIVDMSLNSVGSMCAITSNGTLNCWGSSSIGEFGTGVESEIYSRPQQVGGLSDWEMIDMNGQTSCGIRGGELFCWGANGNGQVGTGSTSTTVLVPYKIDSSTTWTYVSTRDYTCAIKSGELYCWGYNDYGNIGNGSTGGNVLPITRIGALTTWQMVAVGFTHTCGVAGGNLYCWGNNSVGSLGRGTTGGTFNTPQLINSGGWTNVTAGQDNSCGIKDGKLFCWGNNSWGQSINLSSSPLQIGTDTTWSSVHNNYTVTCGIKSGDLFCWGIFAGFAYGEIGLVDAGPGWTKFKSTYNGKGCGIKNGQAVCFPGSSGLGAGALGNGNASGILKDPMKLGSSSWNVISRGQAFSCGIQSGELYCWGTTNGYGQLANGTTTIRENYPRKVGSHNNWTHVSVEKDFGAGIRGGELYWWGYHSGNGSFVTSPTRIGTSSNWTQVSVSSEICGIESGRLFCGNSGSNLSQIGSSATWTHISIGSSAGASHRCGIDAGRLFCWGGNNLGQLGLGYTSASVATPTQVGTATNWTYVSASRAPGVGGTEHTCGISGGSLYCWGSNSSGQNGNNTTTGNATSPVLVSGLTGWTQVETSQGNACGIESGRMFCWGQNTSGQVGSGANFGSNQLTPIQVGSDTDWTSFSIIQYGILGIRNNNLYGWGSRTQFLTNPTAPVTILEFY